MFGDEASGRLPYSGLLGCDPLSSPEVAHPAWGWRHFHCLDPAELMRRNRTWGMLGPLPPHPGPTEPLAAPSIQSLAFPQRDGGWLPVPEVLALPEFWTWLLSWLECLPLPLSAC